ncbi:putative AP superfamily protein [Thermanaerovibrio velox DSM 12556]|uniref:Putative AP superfamily protein n=1 Tax=Thermanaerovibrio velox DSM 12556 TaxID=926567 RepID=H0UMS9_9BACT|nr:alkaline phosphatase family protein [Thermanaerovibrio velox]EHM09224.1 putative AP superfamily protein [Thermanaerovibrio velox DSM 12556]
MSTDRGLVVILVDGLSSKAARHMGCLEGMVRCSMGVRKDIASELPPISKPLYHCIFTGSEPSLTGLMGNHHGAPKRDPENLFALARRRGLVTCAAAHNWFAELFGQWDLGQRGRFQDRPSGDISAGIYYFDDAYPDSHVLQDGEWLIKRHRPGLALVHTMGVDNAAHLYGGDSDRLVEAVMRCDQMISRFLQGLVNQGFLAIVTSDHGTMPSGLHGGTSEDETTVPLWAFPKPPGMLMEAFEGTERQRDMKALMLEFLKVVRRDVKDS